MNYYIIIPINRFILNLGVFVLIDRGGFDRIDANLQKEIYLTCFFSFLGIIKYKGLHNLCLQGPKT